MKPRTENQKNMKFSETSFYATSIGIVILSCIFHIPLTWVVIGQFLTVGSHYVAHKLITVPKQSKVYFAKKLPSRLLLLTLLFWFLPLVCFAEGFWDLFDTDKIHIKVVNVDGKPIPGAEVGIYKFKRGFVMPPAAHYPEFVAIAKTDSSGAANIPSIHNEIAIRKSNYLQSYLYISSATDREREFEISYHSKPEDSYSYSSSGEAIIILSTKTYPVSIDFISLIQKLGQTLASKTLISKLLSQPNISEEEVRRLLKNAGRLHYSRASEDLNLNLSFLPDIEKLLHIVLPKIKNVTSLDLRLTDLNDESIRLLESQPFIRILKLSFTKISDTAVKTISKLEKLEDLNIDRTDFSDQGALELIKLPSLPKISYHGTKITPYGHQLMVLKRHGTLEVDKDGALDLPDNGAYSGLFDQIKLNNLKATSLKLKENILTKKVLSDLGYQPNLVTLEIDAVYGDKVPYDVVFPFKNFPALKELDMTYVKVGENFLMNLKMLVHLRHFILLGATLMTTR